MSVRRTIVIVMIFVGVTVLSPIAIAQPGDAPPPGAGAASESETEIKQSVRFTHLTAEDGLTSNWIEGILQDSRGFVWIGADSGLNRFDGYRITTYTHNPDDPGRQSQEGTGLGLPISRKFVQLMGGDMRVKSEVGHGTLFAFEIQVQVVNESEMTSKISARRAIALEPGQPRYRILIKE